MADEIMNNLRNYVPPVARYTPATGPTMWSSGAGLKPSTLWARMKFRTQHSWARTASNAVISDGALAAWLETDNTQVEFDLPVWPPIEGVDPTVSIHMSGPIEYRLDERVQPGQRAPAGELRIGRREGGLLVIPRGKQRRRRRGAHAPADVQPVGSAPAGESEPLDHPGSRGFVVGALLT